MEKNNERKMEYGNTIKLIWTDSTKNEFLHMHMITPEQVLVAAELQKHQSFSHDTLIASVSHDFTIVIRDW